MGKLGRIRTEKRADGRAFYLDFRPYGRVWSHRGIRIRDEETARRVLESIRSKVAEGRPLDEVLAEFLPANAKPNLVPTWLQKWVAMRKRDCEAGTLSPLFVSELERLIKPGNHFSFFDEISIHELNYGVMEDWIAWMADRQLGPKSRQTYAGYFRAFVTWIHKRGEIRERPDFPSVKLEEHDPQILSAEEQDDVLDAIPDADRGIFLAMARLGIRPGEARALQAADYHNDWITVDKAVKGKSVTSPVRGTKTGKPKRLPLPEDLIEWIEVHVPKAGRLTREPLFANPRTGRSYAHKTLQAIWKQASEDAEVRVVPLYEGTKHSFATDAIRRGVPERLLQKFLGHAHPSSTRRYARLADTALIRVLQPQNRTDRHVTDKGSENEPEQNQLVSGGPSWVRTRDQPVMSRML